jgi:hypothetical protein
MNTVNKATPGYNPGYPAGGTAPAIPTPQDTMSLPIFNPIPGNTDTGVGHSGDLGGAGPR